MRHVEIRFGGRPADVPEGAGASPSPDMTSLPPGAERSTPLAMLGQGACAWLRAASGGGLRPVFDRPAPGGLVEVSGRRASPQPALRAVRLACGASN